MLRSTLHVSYRLLTDSASNGNQGWRPAGLAGPAGPAGLSGLAGLAGTTECLVETCVRPAVLAAALLDWAPVLSPDSHTNSNLLVFSAQTFSSWLIRWR